MVRVWGIYQLLHLTRQVGANGPQPVSMSDIHAVAVMTGYDKTDDFDFLLYAIPSLDQEFLSNYYEEAAKKADRKKPNTRPNR